MAVCPICDQLLVCSNAGDPQHQQAVNHAAQDCPLRKGFIWVQVLDDKGGSVPGAKVNIAGKDAVTDDSGFAYSDPLDPATKEAKLESPLPDAFKDTHLPPTTVDLPATVKAGDVTLIKFRLDRINIVTPKVEEEYKVVLLERGLAAHQTGEPDTDKLYAMPTRIEVSVTETNRAKFPLATTAKLIYDASKVKVYRDDKCETELTEDLKADEITEGKKLKLWLRGVAVGTFDLSVELAPTGDAHIVPATPAPAPIKMGVVELILEVYRQDLAAIKNLTVNPDQEPISAYHTALNGVTWPVQTKMDDEAKVKVGRLLHVQKDANHGRARVVIKKIDSSNCPPGTDNYEVHLNHTNKSGETAPNAAEWDGTSTAFPRAPFLFSELQAADKEVWIEGKTACTAMRGVTLDLALDRPAGGLAKTPKRYGDWARFTVVKINDVKLDYTPVAGQPDAWDSAGNRFFINLKTGTDGRKITIGAQLSAELIDVTIHFMLVEHKDNRKTANWGVNLPDGTRALTPVAAVNNAGTPQVFPNIEPKWTWKDITADVKHEDKATADRSKILHYSEKTNDKGYAKKEVVLSQFGGDKFYLAAYIEEDAHLAKYIDGHTPLGNRKPVMRTDPIQVWRKFWYKEVKVEGLLVSGFRDAPDTYKDVKAVMAPGTVVEMPRTTADGISPPVIYPKHMVSYYVQAGSYRNNYPGDNGDALIVGDTNRSQFFSLAHAEADKPVMYAMMNTHALWIPGGTDGVPVNVGPFTHPFALAGAFPVSITTNNELIDPPLQGGTLLVTGQGRWDAEDWIPHGDPTTPTGPNAPPGSPPGQWGNARNGTLAATDVSLDPNRSDPRAFRVAKPAAVVVATYTRIKLSAVKVQCAASFLGTSYADGIVNAYTLNDEQDFVNTINHETGHAFLQATATRPGSAPAHPLQYEKSGSHCAFDAKKCVMYESGPIAGSLNRYCPVCHPYLLVADMSTVRGNLT